MRDSVLSSAGVQDTDASGFEILNSDDIENFRENPQFEVEAAFRPGIDTPLLPLPFDILGLGGSIANHILLDDEEDKEKQQLLSPKCSHFTTHWIDPMNPSCLAAKWSTCKKNAKYY